MELLPFFKDKTIKPSERAGIISRWLIDGSLSCTELIAFAITQKEAVAGSCIEAIEHATLNKTAIVSTQNIEQIIDLLKSDAPRVKWECARTIGNVISGYPDLCNKAVQQLLPNTTHPGTVVRWSAAIALSEVLLMKTEVNGLLLQEIEKILATEEKNSIKNIYLKALKKLAKNPLKSSKTS